MTADFYLSLAKQTIKKIEDQIPQTVVNLLSELDLACRHQAAQGLLYAYTEIPVNYRQLRLNTSTIKVYEQLLNSLRERLLERNFSTVKFLHGFVIVSFDPEFNDDVTSFSLSDDGQINISYF